MVVKWTFQDPSGFAPASYVFEVNPNEGGLPEYKKNFGFQVTTAPDGKVLMFEGRPEPRRGTFSGVSLSQAQHEVFETWFNKRNQIIVTDDLGRSFTIVIESYAPKRRWSVQHNWRHDYTINYIIVDW